MGAEERALLLDTAGRDFRLTRDALDPEGVEAVACDSAEELEALAREGVGLLILAEEDLAGESRVPLARVLRDQPSWSDLPVLVLADSTHSLGPLLIALEGLGNVLILERSVQRATFVTAIRAALRARRGQYETRELLARLEETDRRRDEWLTMLGHELRNPLGAARTTLQLLEEEQDSPADRRRQIDRIEHQIGRLTRWVDGFLGTLEGRLGVFVLPAVTPAPEVDVPRLPGVGGASSPDGSGNGGEERALQVLVVEDMPDARDALGELLGLHGYDVTLAADGEEAIRAAFSHPPDVALVDIGLPGVDGYEVARRLRSGPLRQLHLVAMTGYGQAESRDRALEAGFDRYLVKPVDPTELLSLLDRRAG